MLVVLWVYVVAGIAAAHIHGLWRRDRATLATLAVLDAVALLFIAIGIADPDRFRAWMQEDGWVEWWTFHAFFGAGLVTVWTLRGSFKRPGATPAPRWLYRSGLALLALFCLVVAMEEISWGQRLFGLKPPEFFLAENYQQELNLHNLLKGRELGFLKLDSRYLVALVAAFYGIALPLLGAFARASRLGLPLLGALPPVGLSPWFAAVALAALIRLPSAAPSPSPTRLPLARRILAGAGLSLLLGLITPLLLTRVVFRGDGERVAVAEVELARLRADLESPGTVTADLLRTNLHKRVFTATLDGYLRFGDESAFLEGRQTPAEPEAVDPRRDRIGYFLDPWNNPYWVHFQRRSRRVILYSFGPNRRRDSHPGKDGELSGDDIGLVFFVRPHPEP
jgi:hypothetical protein